MGRVACIINHKANRTWNEQTARFGWIDFIDDLEVSGALLRQAEDWAREHHCTKLVGPLGFTDLDAEGMLIDGFDQLSTMSTIYISPTIRSILSTTATPTRSTGWNARSLCRKTGTKPTKRSTSVWQKSCANASTSVCANSRA